MADVRLLIDHLARQNITQIQYADVADNWLERRMTRACTENHIQLVKYRTPNFLNDIADVAGFSISGKPTFKQIFILINVSGGVYYWRPNGKPIGGKWTYDSDNRLRFLKMK